MCRCVRSLNRNDGPSDLQAKTEHSAGFAKTGFVLYFTAFSVS
jgi:hypothetical protein